METQALLNKECVPRGWRPPRCSPNEQRSKHKGAPGWSCRAREEHMAGPSPWAVLVYYPNLIGEPFCRDRSKTKHPKMERYFAAAPSTDAPYTEYDI